MNIPEIIRHFEATTAAEQQEAVLYFNRIKNSMLGWHYCTSLLSSDAILDERVRFFCFQVMEHYVKTRYVRAPLEELSFIRSFMIEWVKIQCHQPDEKIYIRKKAAQFFSMVFVKDYLLRWGHFFVDLLSTLCHGRKAVEHYLRILVAVDAEINDRDDPSQDTVMTVAIKDQMRRNGDVDKLTESWYSILDTYGTSDPIIICLVLKSIGGFVSWIDLSVVGNQCFVMKVVKQLLYEGTREAAAHCLQRMIKKGMDAQTKMELVDWLSNFLKENNLLKPLEGDETDFSMKMGKLLNTMGVNVLECYNKFSRAGLTNEMSDAMAVLDRQYDSLLLFLNDEYDDVSNAVIEYAREYIHAVKNKFKNTLEHRSRTFEMLRIVLHKYKFDDNYNFDHEGEDEDTFLEYRKKLRVLFCNLATVDPEMVCNFCGPIIKEQLEFWQTRDFRDVELALQVLHMFGDTYAHVQTNKCDETTFALQRKCMAGITRVLSLSGVSNHPHPYVQLMFFEAAVKCDKFITEEDHTQGILTAFLDQRGLRNPNCKIRSRVCFLIARLVKNHYGEFRKYKVPVMEELMNAIIPSSYSVDGALHSLHSPDDEFYLFETCGTLIVCGSFNIEEKQHLLKQLLEPLLDRFNALLGMLMSEEKEASRDKIARALCHCMALTNRTSKAFSYEMNMKSFNCTKFYTSALELFLQVLQVPYPNQIPMLRHGVKQYVHRMIVCWDNDMLGYLHNITEGMLKMGDEACCIDYIPLINQVVCKFKEEVLPFLYQAFLPIVKTMMGAMTLPIEDDDHARRDRQALFQVYFTFMYTIISSDTIEALEVVESSALEQILMSVVQGATDYEDRISQKWCLIILGKLVEKWGGKENLSFPDFMHKHIIPTCILAPLTNPLDARDAQTHAVLYECANCLLTCHKQCGEELQNYLLQLLMRNVNIPHAVAVQFCQSFKMDNKDFKRHFKSFVLQFNQVRNGAT